MSCVITKHRVRDYTKLGLPNARMRGQQQPHAQGGAQNINIVNNIGEDVYAFGVRFGIVRHSKEWSILCVVCQASASIQ